jgi:hypothetical protein
MAGGEEQITLPLGEISHRRGPAASAFAARSTLLIDRKAKAVGGRIGRIVVSMVGRRSICALYMTPSARPGCELVH